jgi:hypothetical protein
MGRVKGMKTCIASEFPDALGSLGRVLSVLGRCGRARSGGGRCRRCRKATSISLSIGPCLLEGMALVFAVSRLLTEVAGHSRTTMACGRRCEQSCVASRTLRMTSVL